MRWALTAWTFSWNSRSNPLVTDSTTTSEATPSITPTVETVVKTESRRRSRKRIVASRDDQRDDHSEGFQGAVMAARGQDDGKVHHRASQGDKRAQPHHARLGFPAQVARAHESFETKPEEQRKAGEQGQ